MKKAEKDNYKVDPNSIDSLRNLFELLRDLPGWGNGRDVNQIFEDVLQHRATRIVNNIERIKTITASDVEKAKEKMISVRNIKITPSSKKMDYSSLLTEPQFQQKQQEKQHQKQQEKMIIKEISNNEDDSINQKQGTTGRDEGVSDEDWQELERAKLEEKEKEERLKKELEEAERQKNEKIKQAILEEIRKKEEMKNRIRAIGKCPAGFNWFNVGKGWRCGGGSHFVSDEQLKSQFGYVIN